MKKLFIVTLVCVCFTACKKDVVQGTYPELNVSAVVVASKSPFYMNENVSNISAFRKMYPATTAGTDLSLKFKSRLFDPVDTVVTGTDTSYIPHPADTVYFSVKWMIGEDIMKLDTGYSIGAAIFESIYKLPDL